MGKKTFIICLVALFCLPMAAWAGPKVGIQVTAEKEVKVNENGKQILHRVKAETVEPGEVIFYTLTYENHGDQKAVDVVINNPIPEGTAYLPGSAYGDGSTLLYSIDNGQTYKKPKELIISYTLHDGKKMTRQAYASEYTHIRWVVGEVLAGAGGAVGFQASVK